ncbi:unnamed protein product [Mytilus edulis]|uniref:Uncharacterized protein n=1 Tax=Mytilus edulis TaxID=6550 RepID=A0A8S3QXP4_MYTED|nr:unnamed protein product [Mytilus edulis]
MTDVARCLMEHKAKINIVNEDGRTPLYHACDVGHTCIVSALKDSLEMTHLLLENNADCNICIDTGERIVDTFTNHAQKSLEDEKQDLLKTVMNNGSPNVRNYVFHKSSKYPFRKRSLDYDIDGWDIESSDDYDSDSSSDYDSDSSYGSDSDSSYGSENMDIFPIRNMLYDVQNMKRQDYIFGVVAGSSPLHIACFMGWLDVGRCLLKHNSNINLTKEDGTTPLFYACEVGHTDMVRVLLAKGADTQISRLDGKFPLNIAICNAHTKIIKLLLDKSSNVDLYDNDGCSPLISASFNGQSDIVELLLKMNPNVNHRNKNGVSPLHAASKNGHTDIVRLLLMNNSNVDLWDNDVWSPLYMASWKGHTNIVRLLLEKNPNNAINDNKGFSPLQAAIRKEHTDIVSLMLEKNRNVHRCENEWFATALWSSCIINSTCIVQLLIKHIPDNNVLEICGSCALFLSTLYGNENILQLLLENNVDSNICLDGKLSITNMLTTNYPYVRLDDASKQSSDFYLKRALSNVIDYVRMNMTKNLDYAIDVISESSPLHIACFTGKIHVVHCLLEHKANINMKKHDGTTPLILCM